MNRFIVKCAFVGLLFISFGAQAQMAPQPSAMAVQFAQLVSKACLNKQWETPACLSAVSNSNLALAATYGSDLQNKGFAAAAEQIKQHCAASTAAREQAYPAYAMKSAFTECANMIYDVSEQTKVTPDQAHYQLLVAPILCMSNDQRCLGVEQGLAPYAR